MSQMKRHCVMLNPEWSSKNKKTNLKEFVPLVLWISLVKNVDKVWRDHSIKDPTMLTNLLMLIEMINYFEILFQFDWPIDYHIHKSTRLIPIHWHWTTDKERRRRKVEQLELLEPNYSMMCIVSMSWQRHGSQLIWLFSVVCVNWSMRIEANDQHFYQMFESIMLHSLKWKRSMRTYGEKNRRRDLACEIKCLQFISKLTVDTNDNQYFE